MKLRLTKREIVRGHERFHLIIRGGRKMVGKYVIAFAVHSEDVEIGVSVGRRICNAVRRNREKRRLREIYRRNKSCFSGLSVLLVARNHIIGVSFRSLQDDVIRTVNLVRKKIKEDRFEQTRG